MTYEQTPIKASKGLAESIKIDNLQEINTGKILWLLVKRHKFGLVSTWAIIITVLYMMPFAPDLVLNLFR